MPTYTFTPSSVVPQGGDGAVVYSSGVLDSFGTDETPVGWPSSGKVTAIEVEVTSTDFAALLVTIALASYTVDKLRELAGLLL